MGNSSDNSSARIEDERQRFRLIETETGEIKAAVNKTEKRWRSSSILAEELSDELIFKLITLYPLRGRILQVQGDEVMLNIGRQHGVRTGQQFKVVGGGIMLTILSVEKENSKAMIKDDGAVLTVGQQIQLN